MPVSVKMKPPPLFDVVMKCPLCHKRVCDLSAKPKEKLKIELKCPNCHRLVRVSCAKDTDTPK